MTPGQRRFVAKSFGTGRNLRWGVYDRATASWPIHRPELGMVAQAMTTEAAAQAEAARCEQVVPA